VAERRGFTLIELLVAIVIGGGVVSVLFQLIAGQGRFVELQSAREEVQQNTRAALELIGSELRTLPAGDALVQASADSITLRSARVWGVVCNVPGATALDVALPVMAGASYAANAGTGLVVNLGTTAEPLWSNAVGVMAVGSPATECGGAAVGAGVERRTLTLSATPQQGATTPLPGHIVYLFDQVTYRSGTSTTVPGVWIQRRLGDGGSGQNQPMAGPIREGGAGLVFQYFAGGSATPLATPILDAATRREVTRVLVVVESVSRNGSAGARVSKADTIVVSLRNRRA
jgi:prepilin-type N-terminal cleavage/methylation domain-containing protein